MTDMVPEGAERHRTGDEALDLHEGGRPRELAADDVETGGGTAPMMPGIDAPDDDQRATTEFI